MQVWVWGDGMGWGGGSVYLSIHPRRYMCCTVPKGPLRASTSFFGGEAFSLLFFSWIAWGNLQQQQKKTCLVLFISFFFRGGVLVLLLLLLGSTWLSFFLSRAGEFGRGKMEERREERKAV